MSLLSALSIANGGLANINHGLAIVSQNVANVGTPDWTREVATQASFAAGGLPLGVRSQPTQRDLDALLQAGVFQQNAAAAGARIKQTALAGIDQVQGPVAGGTDLASLVGKLGDAFSTLATNPANQTGQRAVVAAAAALAAQINALSAAVGQARQAAQDQAARDVDTLDATLARVGGLSDQITRLQATGQDTADLQNQRDAAIDQISTLVPVRPVQQANGEVLLLTSSGLSLPTHGGARPFSLAAASLGATLSYPASAAVPGLTLGGVDVTAQFGASGTIGANLTLRDVTLPTYQAGLDEFAHTLASRFDDQGLTLFTDGGAAVPAATGPLGQSGYLGFAGEITVNPAVAANAALVRDGTHAVAGSPSGASAFTPNPAGGPAGFTDLIARITDFALSAEARAGVAQTSPSGAGLGAAGGIALGYAPPAALGSFAAALVGRMSADSGAASAALDSAQSLQGALQSRLTSESGVSIDREMSSMIELQHAYGANARVITTVQTMWDTLLQMVR